MDTNDIRSVVTVEESALDKGESYIFILYYILYFMNEFNNSCYAFQHLLL